MTLKICPAEELASHAPIEATTADTEALRLDAQNADEAGKGTLVLDDTTPGKPYAGHVAGDQPKA